MRTTRNLLEHKIGNAVLTHLPADGRFVVLYREAPDARLRVVSNVMVRDLPTELRAMADWIEQAQPEPEFFNV